MTTAHVSATPAAGTPKPAPIPPYEPAVLLSVEEQEAMVGKMADPIDPNLPNRPHFCVALDEGGHPTGAVLAEPPDGPYISVWYDPPAVADQVMTASGAPLTSRMNPDHTFRDAALEARNPASASADKARQDHIEAQKKADAEAKKKAETAQKK